MLAGRDGQVGCVGDVRRIAGALTRARRQLVVIGDSGTLGGHARCARLLEALAERGWSAQDLGALTSGNIRRVLGDAEDVADGRDEPRRH